MDSKKRRSSLRKSLAADTISGDIKSAQKRRISFSGKKSVRIFSGEEEPKAWDNSFEISDHLNVNETAKNVCAPSNIKELQSSQITSYANKKNYIEFVETKQKDSCHQQNNFTNLSIGNISGQRMTNDFINASDQINKTCRIENSIDITLIEHEKRFKKEVSCSDHTSSNSLSFSLEDNERKGQFGEKTYDFIRDLKNYSNEKEDNMRIFDSSKKKDDQITNNHSAPHKNEDMREFKTFCKSDSLSLKSNVEIWGKTEVKRKSIYEVSAMQLTLNEAQHLDKENVKPISMEKANQTQNSSYQMEVDDLLFSNPQINEDSNKAKSRPTIYFDQRVETLTTNTMNISTKKLKENVTFENNKTSRSSIYFNKSIDIDAHTTNSTAGGNASKGAIPKVKPFIDEDMVTTLHGTLSQDSGPCQTNCAITNCSRRTMNLNEDMDTTSYGTESADAGPCPRKTFNLNEDINTTANFGTSSTRKTMNLNEDMNTSPLSASVQDAAVPYPTNSRTNFSRKTINLNEDMDTTAAHGTLMQNSNSHTNLNFPANSHIIRENQPAKIIFRKICLPTPNKEKSLFESRQQGTLRLEQKEQEHKTNIASGTDSAVVSANKKEQTNVNKSLNFSVESLKNFSLCSDNSSPLLPAEFKGYTLKQLNDEIESGRIKVFPNAQKTPIINRKRCNITSELRPDNEPSAQSLLSDRQSLLFEDAASSKVKYRYSQADELMLDNTSFLARAKLSDETMSHKSSKRDSTQFNNTMDICDETLSEAAGTPEDGLKEESLKVKNMCNQENNNISSVRQRTLPEVANINNNQKLMSSMDVSINNDQDYENEVLSMKFPLLQRSRECQKAFTQAQLFGANKENIPVLEPDNICNSKTTRATLYCNQMTPLEETVTKAQENIQATIVKNCGKTMVFRTKSQNESIMNDDKFLVRNADIDASANPFRKTIYYENDSIIDGNDLAENPDVASSDFNPPRRTLYFNKDVSFNVDSENNAQVKESEACIYQNPSRQTLLFATNIQEESILPDKTTGVEGSNIDSSNLDLTRNNEIPLAKETTSKENKQSDLAGNDIYSSKPFIDQSITKDDENTDIVPSCNFNPSRKTLYCNNEISVQYLNVTTEEIVPDAPASKPCLSQIPSRRTLFFETKIEEDSILKDDYNRVEKADETLCSLGPVRKILSLEKDASSIDQTNIPYKTSVSTNKIPFQKLSACENQQLDCTDTYVGSAKPMRKTMYFQTEIQDESIMVVDDGNTHVLSPSSCKKMTNNKEITLESLNVSQNPSRKTMFFETNIQEEGGVCIQNKENIPVVNTNKEPLRKTLYYNGEIPLENTLTEVEKNSPGKEKEESNARMSLKNPAQSEFNSVNGEYEKYPRKTIYFNTKIYGLKIPKQNVDETNNSHQEKDELLYLTLDNLNIINNADIIKARTFESKLPARRKSVYSPENMDLTLHDEEVLNENDINEQISNIVIDETKHEPEKLEADSNQLSSFVGDTDQSFKPAETYQFHEPSVSVNAAKLTLSRRFAKSGFMTPKKLSGANNNFSLCITPRLSLLEFEQLENEEKATRAINHKRLASNLTPVFSVTKKKQSLNFDDCSHEVVEPTKENDEEPPFADGLNDKTMSSDVDANESVVKTPSRERKSLIPIAVNSSTKMQKSYSLIEADNCTQKENDSQLESGNDNFAESIQLMRRATTFANRDDTISEQHTSLQPPKPSIFEGNPITISDVSVFFEAQRKSHIDATKAENSPPTTLEVPNSLVLQPLEQPKTYLESRFINLTLEDIDKTHLSLVRGDEYDDEDDVAGLNDVKEEEKHSSGSANTLERRRTRKSAAYLRNETSLVCRKCKRCQETFLNETTSSTSESFVMPEIPPIPDLGMERLRRLRKRPSIADANVLWQRVSLDRTIYNTNISDNTIGQISDFDDEIEDKDSIVSKFIRKFYEDMRSFETMLLEKPQITTSSLKLPFVLRLEALLRKDCPNWIFDYQAQFRGILFFTHQKFYTFTLVVTFDEVDSLGNEMSLKSVKLEKGRRVPKKNWKAIDFVIEFQLKLNLPFDIQWLCKGSSEFDLLEMLQEVDRRCLETLKLVKELQLVCLSNQASIVSYTGGTYVRKIYRKIVDRPNSGFKHVKTTEIQVELLNLEKLSFKDITFPQLHNFREEVHLLPTGLQFLREFLPNALDYLKDY